MRFLIYFLPFAFIISMVLSQEVPNISEIEENCRFSTSVNGEVRKFLLVEQIGDGDIIMYTNLKGKEKQRFRDYPCIYNKPNPESIYMDF